MKKFKEYKVGKFTFIDKTSMTPDEWRGFRKEGIGGSDVSSILDLNPYSSITELFYEKIGHRQPENLDRNVAVFWGNMDEYNLIDVAQYYDYNAEIEEYVVNYMNKKKIRNIVLLNYIIKHDDYPWLIINPDGVEVDMDVTQSQVDQAIQELGKLYKIYNIEETKTISGMTADTWESGIPIGYVGQVITYQIPFKEQYPEIGGNIWSKKDGRHFEGHPVPWNDTLYETIVTECSAFWELVKEGRSIMKEGLGVSKTEHLLDAIAPTPKTVTPAYEQFLNQRLKERKEKTIDCPADIFEKAVQYKALKAEAKEPSDKATIKSVEIKEYMIKNDALVLDAGENGKISFNKRLYINIK
jgi:hypothetical protein